MAELSRKVNADVMAPFVLEVYQKLFNTTQDALSTEQPGPLPKFCENPDDLRRLIIKYINTNPFDLPLYQGARREFVAGTTFEITGRIVKERIVILRKKRKGLPQSITRAHIFAWLAETDNTLIIVESIKASDGLSSRHKLPNDTNSRHENDNAFPLEASTGKKMDGKFFPMV
jgi:hypothetical protein